MIFPTTDTAGGIVVRDPNTGAPLNPPNVQNAYSRSPAFVTTCPVTALPSDCTARIEARQINNIVSELLSFAECLDPNGLWDCTSLSNLCTAFTDWWAANKPVMDGVSIVGSGTTADPYRVGTVDGGVY